MWTRRKKNKKKGREKAKKLKVIRLLNKNQKKPRSKKQLKNHKKYFLSQYNKPRLRSRYLHKQKKLAKLVKNCENDQDIKIKLIYKKIYNIQSWIFFI